MLLFKGGGLQFLFWIVRCAPRFVATHKKTERSKEHALLLSVFLRFVVFEPFLRITFRDSRQKPLTSYDLWRDGWPARGDHSLWPFSHGSRACSRDGDCVAEMFFSLLYTYFIYYYFYANSPNRVAKVLIIFEITKNYMIFTLTFYVFF